MARTTPASSRTVCVDFETYWDTEFTLSKMSVSEYVRDPRFKVHCAAIKIGERPVRVVWGHDAVGAMLKMINWKTHAFLAQNTLFDGFILSHCYGIVPHFYFDTKSMAAGLLNGIARTNLAVLAPLYGAGVKDATSLQSTKGMLEIPEEWRDRFAQYNTEDCEQCWHIFKHQIQTFPVDELHIIDLVIRMFCDSKLLVDEQRARNALAEELLSRRSAILKSGITEEELRSDDKFAAALSQYIEPPTKISKTTKETAWAFSLTDEPFLDLQESEDVRVARLVLGRIAAKSSQAETRAYRLLEAGKNGQVLPVGYTYSAAITHRLGGTNKLNLQNLERKSELRKSIIAPEGHVLVVGDSAQIEARQTAWLCGQENILDLFRAKKDVYKTMASAIYTLPVEEITEDQRFIGKIAVLGLGYNMGHRNFQTTLALGTQGPPVDMPLQECQRIVNLYRSMNAQIVKGWGIADAMLWKMHAGLDGEIFDGIIRYDATTLWLPNGMPIHYPDLRPDDNGDLSYFSFKGRKKIYGGKCLENIVQALARIVVFTQILEIRDELALLPLHTREVARVSMTTHDEVVSCVPERLAKEVSGRTLTAMRRAPKWCKTLPVNAEVKYSREYCK